MKSKGLSENSSSGNSIEMKKFLDLKLGCDYSVAILKLDFSEKGKISLDRRYFISDPILGFKYKKRTGNDLFSEEFLFS